jgi:transketolase
VVRTGSDVLFLACGGIAHEALAAAATLDGQGVSAAVAVMAHLTFRPSPELMHLVQGYDAVVTVEEGYLAGGLGSLVAEGVASHGLSVRVEARGVADSFSPESGSEGFMRTRAGIDAPALVKAALTAMASRHAG